MDTEFDPASHIAKYRSVIAQRDKQPEGSNRDLFDLVARRLREEWKDWHGTDTLDEMAFGSQQAKD